MKSLKSIKFATLNTIPSHFNKCSTFVIIILSLIVLSIKYETISVLLKSSSFKLMYESSTKLELSDLLLKIPDSKLRLSKLKADSRLGVISMWVAFPSSDAIVPGTSWYDPLWNNYDISGFRNMDEMISLSPCRNNDKIFIQIGAHLGIYPLLAAYRGCRAIAVEPMPLAVTFTKISGILNGWNKDAFLPINAVGSHTSGGSLWFDPRTISISVENNSTEGKLRIPVTTLDELNEKYGYANSQTTSQISFVVIDVEGFEQDVLLGAKNLIEKRSVIAFEIEVWSAKPKFGPITRFPGLDLLAKNGYRLYTYAYNPSLDFKSCDEITDRLSELPGIMNHSCIVSGLSADTCLTEVFAIRSDYPPPRQWSSSCQK